MKSKRSLASVALELAAVLLVTALAFVWGVQTAQAERGYDAIGGEYLLLLIPFLYYIGKRMILDWIATLNDLDQAGDHDERYSSIEEPGMDGKAGDGR